MECLVHRLPMRHPADVGGVVQLIDDGQLLPAEIVAILAKTEGNGCVNDFHPRARNARLFGGVGASARD